MPFGRRQGPGKGGMGQGIGREQTCCGNATPCEVRPCENKR